MTTTRKGDHATEDREFAHRLRDLLMVTGYNNGVSTILGTVQSLEERYFLKRVPANSWDDLTFFEAKTQGNYDERRGD